MTQYRSSHGLTTCPSCQRHIAAAELPSKTVCPFCSEARPLSIRGGVLAASLFALSACGAPAADTTPEESTDTQGGETTGTVPSEDLVAVPVYGIAVPPEQVPDETPADTDESQDSSEDPQATEGEFEPAPNMQPMARYGMAPSR